jgi:hypothetical protein
MSRRMKYMKLNAPVEETSRRLETPNMMRVSAVPDQKALKIWKPPSRETEGSRILMI